jgi:hypothetical protein
MEVEQALKMLDSSTIMIKLETEEETTRLDAVAEILAKSTLTSSGTLRQVSLQKLRKAMGLPKPVTKKMETKLFNQLRHKINQSNKTNIITKSGYMRGVKYQNDDGSFPNLRQRKQLVLRSAARYLGEEIAKNKVAAQPVDESTPMHIPEPGANVTASAGDAVVQE